MPIMTILLAVAKAALVVFGSNLAIDKYADWKTSQMASIPVLLDTNVTITSTGADEEIANVLVWTPSELRKTVNKRSELVENLEHRKAWNRWILLPSTETTATATILLDSGEYKYAYRSYVNYEEAGGIRKRLWHWPTIFWGYVQPTPGTITISGRTTTVTTPAASDDDNDDDTKQQ